MTSHCKWSTHRSRPLRPFHQWGERSFQNVIDRKEDKIFQGETIIEVVKGDKEEIREEVAGDHPGVAVGEDE